jgi:predicted permease
MFTSFGLRPALGRLLFESDDRTPGAHPYAVLSHDYWTRRFAQDPKVIGRTFRLADDSMGNVLYEIVGVGPQRFTGTEPGSAVDLFLPAMMYSPSVNQANLVWLRTFIKLKPNVSLAPVRDRLSSTFQSLHDDFNGDTVSLEPAAAGVSGMQDTYRLSLTVLGLLVALVLLIASANVANLMTAQASSRAREMALRVAIGAGRFRLAQLVLVESALLAVLAAAAGAIFAWWSAPFVVGMINPPGDPARLFLPADWRVLGFGAALTLGVTFLFGLAPALRASSIKPASALRGGEGTRHRRGMNALIAVQAAFCFLVLFVAGLFVATFDRLTSHATGFSAERLLTLNVVADRPQPTLSWDQLVEHLRSAPGVEAVASAGFPLLIGSTWSARISSHGETPSEDFAYRLAVSPGWMDVMRIPLLAGRNLLANDAYPEVAIVNQAFAKRYYGGANPIGKTFETVSYKGERIRSRIVGLAGDALYRDLHERVNATAYVPMHATDAKGGLTARNSATLLVRTAGANPLALASTLRREVARAQPQFRVKEIRTQTEINQAHAVRERLLAMLALFFAIVALLLAGVGLYGVLDYTVLQRRRELGIRMALGAQAAQVARGVTFEVFAMLLAGSAAGLALGVISVRYISTLLYQVKATDAGMLAVPSLAIFAAAVVAAMPAVIRAVRIDPATALRSE